MISGLNSPGIGSRVPRKRDFFRDSLTSGARLTHIRPAVTERHPRRAKKKEPSDAPRKTPRAPPAHVTSRHARVQTRDVSRIKVLKERIADDRVSAGVVITRSST